MSGRAVAAALLLGGLLVLGACGSGGKDPLVNRMTTPQQEATDLKRALDAGVITPAEFETQKRRLGLP